MNGGMRRSGDPDGGSTVTTSAPNAANTIVANAPLRPARSITLKPANGPDVSPGAPGNILETDVAFRRMADRLRSKTGLSFTAAFGAIDAITKLGFKIREPNASTATLTELE